ncbi:MAG: MFS transporter, partial [Ensifer adhaerens]
LYTLQRMTARGPVPAGERALPFRNLLRTSSFFNKLAAGNNHKRKDR